MGDRLERERKLKEEIRQRLKGVCSNLSQTEFEELIDKIAANQLKGEYRPYKLISVTRPESSAGESKAPPRPRRSA